MKARSVAAIGLRPSTGQDGYYFMSLETGKRVHARTWHQLPIPDFVIDRVHELSNREGEPDFIRGYPVFEWSPGVPIDDDQDEEDD